MRLDMDEVTYQKSLPHVLDYLGSTYPIFIFPFV